MVNKSNIAITVCVQTSQRNFILSINGYMAGSTDVILWLVVLTKASPRVSPTFPKENNSNNNSKTGYGLENKVISFTCAWNSAPW